MKKISELRKLAKETRPKVSQEDLTGLLEIIDRQQSIMKDVFELCARVRSESDFRGLVVLPQTASDIQARVAKLSVEVKK